MRVTRSQAVDERSWNWLGACLGLILLAGGQGRTRAGTEFGGALVEQGGSSTSSTLLSGLQTRGGLAWIRGHSATTAAFGFRRIDDIRHYLSAPTPESGPLPSDLFEVYRAGRDRIPTGDGAPVAWEVWNEPDFYFVSDNASDMAAVLKAAWWGIRSKAPNATILMPSLAFAPSRYAVELAQNGVARWTDGWNIHFYGWAADYPDFLAQHRSFTEALGWQAPLWVTEVGYLQMPQSLVDDLDTLGRQAAFHERAMAESWIGGVARHFVFSLDAFRLSSWELGLSDSAGRGYPALDSVIAMARRLEGTRPLWRLVHQRSGASIGVVLEEADGRWWTMLWSPGRPRESGGPAWNSPPPALERLRLTLRWPRSVPEIHVGLDAATSLVPSQMPQVELAPERNVHWRTPPGRFELEGCRWERLNAPLESPSMRRTSAPGWKRSLRRELATVPAAGTLRSTVVVRWRAGSGWVTDKPSQTQRLLRGARGDASLDLYNFGVEPVRGRWEIETPTGWTCGTSSISDASVCHGDVVIQPQSHVAVPVSVQCSGVAPGDSGRVRIRWRAEDGAADDASVLWQPVVENPTAWHRFGWRDFLARGSQPDAWQVFETHPGEYTFEIRRPGGPQGDVALFLELPRGKQTRDWFCARVKAPSAAGRPFGQLFLMTADGEVWRHGEWRELTPEGWEWRAALGDFSPTVWSRRRTMVEPPVSEARWLVLRFQGLAPGQVLEVIDPALCRDSRPRAVRVATRP
ncbi:MAG: hypothetical protein JNK85_21145 [Verrucomicrobiales bacterium]|nr:hypothetical protein [Verrucomicrobiales bacterium]